MRNLVAVILVVASLQGTAQQGKVYTSSDYDRAAAMLNVNTSKFVDNAIRPQWLPDGRVWYRSLTENKSEYKLLDPATGKKVTATTRDEFLKANNVKLPDTKSQDDDNGVPSPDGKYVAFIRDWNLWMKDRATGKEIQLTTDGVKDFGYATDNAGWTHSDRAILSWSPDSKKIATFQQDQRHVSDMYLVKTKVGAPELEAWKYPLPEDKEIIKIHRVIIDISGEPKLVRVKLHPDARRGTLCDDVSCEGGFDDVAWSRDSRKLVFVSTSRDHKHANVRMADCQTGEVKEIFQESVDTQYESGQGTINWKYLSASNEIIWYSERSNWGHLYLYDATTGKLKNQITSGDYVVRQVLHVDEKQRQIYFIASGREKGNPYYRYFYRTDFAGKALNLLTPNEGDHAVSLSPDFKFFTDSYSTPVTPPTHEVRDMKGKLISIVERTDISRLKVQNWKAPELFTVRSADNQWDLFGLLYTPLNLDRTKSYPVIVNIYPGPQGGSIGSWSFAASRGDCQALAELGFVVVQLEGSCNPNRSKAFHDACYGNMGENTLSDHVSGLQQLKQLHPFLDLEKIGIWGHSGGGFATAAAMFKYPDFFKVGISESGNHDNRNYEDDWGERYIGLEVVGEDGRSNYEQQANQTLAKQLKGKLFLIHGGMDDNVPPYNSYLVADALIKSNKDFDFLLLPNARHGYGADSYYVMRRRWDYFIQHLMGGVPPKEYKIVAQPDPRAK